MPILRTFILHSAPSRGRADLVSDPGAVPRALVGPGLPSSSHDAAGPTPQETCREAIMRTPIPHSAPHHPGSAPAQFCCVLSAPDLLGACFTPRESSPRGALTCKAESTPDECPSFV